MTKPTPTPTSTPTEPARIRRRKIKSAGVVTVALIATIGGIVETQITAHGSESGPLSSSATSTPMTAEPEVGFTSPQPGATITTWPSADRVAGMLRGTLPKGWSIFFAVRPAGSDSTYPASAACDVRAGTVLCAEVFLGKRVQAPQTFYLQFWVADSQATAALRARPPGASTPLARPEGAVLTDEIRVARR